MGAGGRKRSYLHTHSRVQWAIPRRRRRRRRGSARGTISGLARHACRGGHTRAAVRPLIEQYHLKSAVNLCSLNANCPVQIESRVTMEMVLGNARAFLDFRFRNFAPSR